MSSEMSREVIISLVSYVKRQIQRGELPLHKVNLLVGKAAETRIQLLSLPSRVLAKPPHCSSQQ